MPVGFEVSAMKASFSLSSLEPTGGSLAESPEHARLRMEKPYNSLTKKPRKAVDSEAENWRHSWGGRDNEDSFLEALMPSYTYLMDNNLIETCREADGELCMDHRWQLLEVAREGKASASQVETLCQEAVEKEIRCLRRWIRGMEKRLCPLDLKAGFLLSELDEKAKEIQCLAAEIESRGKAVASLKNHCEYLVAASENQEPQEQHQSPPEEDEEVVEVVEAEAESTGAHDQPETPKGGAAGSLKVAVYLEDRWHHLYLRALEWQLHIEALLTGKGPKFEKGGNSSSDTNLLDSGAENSSLSSECEEEEGTCSGGKAAGEEQRGGWGEEGRGLGGGGGARRVGGREDGGPQPKQPRLGSEAECEEGASQVMATASEGNSFDSPRYIQNSVNMRGCPQSERILGSTQNCAYFVIRRIDTDSEAEAKDSGVKVEERGALLSNGDLNKVADVVLSRDDSEEDGDEEDDEWVFSRVTTKTLEEKDTKAKKSLQYVLLESKEGRVDSSDKVESKPCARVFEPLKLNSSASDKDKTARIKRWLIQGGSTADESAESQEEQVSKSCPIDSCDASGEYTSSGESSEVESQSSGEMDGSIATCRKSSAVAAVALATAGWNSKVSPLCAQELGISSLSLSPTDGDVTPVAENRAMPGTLTLSPTVKPVLRNKRRKMKLSSHHQQSPKSEQKRRPWSICVSGPGHLVAMSSDGTCVTPSSTQGTGFSTSPSANSPQHAQMTGARSTSESAIHCLAYSSSSCSTGLDDVGSAPGRAGTGSDGLTPTRGSVDGEGLGSGGGSSTGTGSLRRRKVRTRRRALGQRSESGNSDSVPVEVVSSARRGSHLSGKGMSPGSKGSLSQSTSSDYSSSNMVGDETKDEMDDGESGVIREVWNSNGMEGEEMPTEEEDDDIEEEGEKLGSLQTEETSSYSEQAWDNYQVCLSEGGDYSSDDDKKEKEQLLMRLMDFGDDYRNHFDSQSDGGSSLARQQPTPCSTLDSFPGDGMRSLPRSHSPTPPSPGSASRTGSGRRKRQAMPLTNSLTRIRQAFPEVGPQKFLPQMPLFSNGPQSLSPMVNLFDEMGNCSSINILDSDSDLEDVNHILKESRSQFLLMEGYMDKALGKALSSAQTPGKYPPHADYAEIAATCKENIKILKALLDSSDGMDGKGNLLTPRDFWETKDLVLRWEMLESRAEDCHLVRMLRQEIAALRDAMVSPSSERLTDGKAEDLQNRKELDRRIQEVKAEIAVLFQLKNELIDVNVSVNRFLTSAAQPIQCPSVSTSGGKVAPSEETAPEDPCSRADFLFLKEDVAELYREWDDSVERLNAELSVLQRASRTWAELEEGLASLGLALDSDRNTLTTLSTAVAAARSPRKPSSMAQQTPALLAASVRELARVLSEEKGTGKQMAPRGDKEDECDDWDSNVYVDGTDLNGVAHINLEHSVDPLGSLSDSGISDSGSEGLGMCERGKRLAALRKLVRILAATLGPNSAAIVALKERMDDAQKELRSLQKTCRDLVVCTAMLCTATQNRSPIIEESESEAAVIDGNKSACDGVLANDIANLLHSSEGNRFNRLRVSSEEGKSEGKKSLGSRNRKNGGEKDSGSKGKGRKHWAWRVLYLAMPFQLAIVLLLCAAYFLEPHCCSALNNLSFTLTPQLRYVRGPPPT